MLENEIVAQSAPDVAHIIQVALTPVFLLSGIGLLLNVFSLRLGRVADRVHVTTEALRVADPCKQDGLRRRLRHLQRRSHLLDGAVALAAVGGISTCAAVILLFLGTLRDQAISHVLLVAFASAVLCTSGALVAFLIEVLVASRGLREQAMTARGEARVGETRGP